MQHTDRMNHANVSRMGFARFVLLAGLAFTVLSAGWSQDAVAAPTDSTSAASKAAPAGFLDFPGKLNYHMVTGWTSTGLLFAAGAVGAARALDLMNRGHDIREAQDIDDEDDAAIRPLLADLWKDGQTLRWLHAGLLVAGETLYLGDAVTGLSMKIPAGERTLRANIHFGAFLTHATLMASEVVLGFLTTEALKQGNHEAHIGLTAAHAAIGVAIPLVMAGAGLATSINLDYLESLLQRK
jgi:hypothetical protein